MFHHPQPFQNCVLNYIIFILLLQRTTASACHSSDGWREIKVRAFAKHWPYFIPTTPRLATLLPRTHAGTLAPAHFAVVGALSAANMPPSLADARPI
jgi:hypothetical protein